jgi:very-short-patch-repair endonuclease
MAGTSVHAAIWRLARRQHWVVTWDQLIAAGLTRHAIDHRVTKGRLHRLYRGVFAVGRREVDQLGRWMAGVLACGEGAVLSHESAAALWEIRPVPATVEVSVPRRRAPRPPGIVVHRRADLPEMRRRKGIPVTGPKATIIDLATVLSGPRLERVVNEADKLDLVHLDTLRAELDGIRTPGARRLRILLDETTFVLTDSELERLFAPIARDAGLGTPETQVVLHGHRVDFFFRDERLVVETDGLRYHRTPTQQKRDRVRDQELTAAGLRVLRFTHGQVKHEQAHVAEILRGL